MKIKPTTFLLIALINVFSFQLLAQKKNQPVQLASVLEQYSKEYYALHPLEATQAGINDYNNQIEIMISEEYIKKAMIPAAFSCKIVSLVKRILLLPFN